MVAGFRAVVSAASTPNWSLLHVRRFKISCRHDVCRRCRHKRQNRSRRRGFLLDAISRIDRSWWPPWSYGHHEARLPAFEHTTINIHTKQQVSIIKTRKSYHQLCLLTSQGTTRQRIIEPDVRRLRWPCPQCRASAATTTAHIRSICLPSRPACSVCYAGHVRGLGSWSSLTTN